MRTGRYSEGIGRPAVDKARVGAIYGNGDSTYLEELIVRRHPLRAEVMESRRQHTLQ